MDLGKQEDHVEDGCTATCCGDAGDEAVPDSVHKTIIRIIGFFALCFGFIEVGLGAGIFDYTRNLSIGAWWAGMMTLFAAINALVIMNRGWCISTCVLSWVALVFCIAGAASDAKQSIDYGQLNSCSVSSTQFGPITNYGVGNHQYSDACLLTSTSFAADACYCTNTDRSFCGVYRLGYNAVTYGKQNCGGMLTTFPNALRASAALCVLCFILLLALGITSSVVLCCSKDMNALLTTSSKKEDFIPKPQEGEHAEVGLVGTMVHNDA